MSKQKEIELQKGKVTEVKKGLSKDELKMFNKLEKDLRPVNPEEYTLVIDYFKGL